MGSSPIIRKGLDSEPHLQRLSDVPRLTLGRIRKDYIPTTVASHFPARETRDPAKQSKEYSMGNRKENVNVSNTDNKQ
ncbi:hypothetical protein Tco_0080868 [Tanacetum coccineum]